MTEPMIRIQFKDTVHQVCMSHAKNKLVKASNQGSEPNAERFPEFLKESFMKERKYDDAGAEMAETYHSVIGTVKFHGSSVWNFIGTFFQNIYQSPWLPANVKFKTN